MKPYDEMKRKVACGWNTWNTRSVLSHVLLLQGFAVNLGIKEFKTDCVLRESLIGRFGDEEEEIHPAGHAWDGSYTSLSLKWKEMEFIVSSAVYGEDLVLLVEPVKLQKKAPFLIVEAGILWNRKGHVERRKSRITGCFESGNMKVFPVGEAVDDPNVPCLGPYEALTLDRPVILSTGSRRTEEEVRRIIEIRKKSYEKSMIDCGDGGELYQAMQACLAWDTYFAAYMAFDNRELAYSNAIEITRTLTDRGFVPNMGTPSFASLDRSQPPVGSLAVKELYRRYGEKWFLEEVYDKLLAWTTRPCTTAYPSIRKRTCCAWRTWA